MRYLIILLGLFSCTHVELVEPIKPNLIETNGEIREDEFVWKPRRCPAQEWNMTSYFEVAGAAIGTNEPTQVRLYCDSGHLRMTCDYLQINTNDTIYIVTDRSGFYNIEAENFGSGFMYFQLDTIKIWGIDSVRIESVSLRL
jgi:hypothetical protein